MLSVIGAAGLDVLKFCGTYLCDANSGQDGMAVGGEIDIGLQGCILEWIIHVCGGCNPI